MKEYRVLLRAETVQDVIFCIEEGEDIAEAARAAGFERLRELGVDVKDLEDVFMVHPLRVWEWP